MKKSFTLLIILIAALVHIVFALGINYLPTSFENFHPLYEEVIVESPLVDESPSLTEIEPSLFKDTTLIDFEKRQITFVRYDTYSGLPIWQYHYAEFDDYFRNMREYTLLSLWLESLQKAGAAKEKKKFSKLELQLPIHYPAWARRILGKEPPKLSIKGFQSIILGYESRKSDIADVATDDAYDDNTTHGFKFDYENEFIIRGSVGRLLNIEIKAGKNNKGMEDYNFKDQLKKFKIEYKPDPDSVDQLEDEIIQEVIVGYTNFQMPGQGLAGFSGSHEGLFGIKIRSQLGPLSLTTIMSRENVNTKKDTINPLQESGVQTISEKDYVRNLYFFLDTAYQRYYLEKSDKSPDEITPPSEIEELRVYKYDPWKKEGDNPQDFVYAFYKEGSNQAFRFKKLTEYDEHYKFDKKEGWIRFISEAPSDEDIIAIYMRTKDGSIEKGDTTLIDLTNGEKALTKVWVLKNKKFEDDNPADTLMWRNVYSITNAKKEGFTLKVYRKVDGVEPGDDRKNTDSLFSFILGITDKDGNPKKDDEKILDFASGYLIFPPFSYTDANNKKVYSNYPFINPALGKLNNDQTNTNKNIYIDDSLDNAEILYRMETTGASKQTRIQICWGGIMPGSEKMTTQDGVALVKDQDYIIEYDFGSVELISPRAQAATRIYVDYQQESLFMFESKTFIGTYGKLDFPNIGRDSYFATTLMAQFVASRDKIPRVGNEPFNRYLIDANLHFDFEPEWMTTLINYIPFISTSSPSSAILDFEIAGSRVVPDKDNQGEAYVDNFQSSEMNYLLGESHSHWFQASPSQEWLGGTDNFLYHPPAWKSYWYSPISGFRSKRKELMEPDPDRDKNNTAADEDLTTLRLACQPLPENSSLLANVVDSVIVGYDSTGNPIYVDSMLVQPWAGIMAPLSSTYLRDRRKDRYFEFWIKCKKNTGDKGVLYVDLGEVRQDLSLDGGLPDGQINKERKDDFQGAYKSEDDLGLDGLTNENEKYLFPNAKDKLWDTLKFDDPRLGVEFSKDPAKDNWQRYYVDQTTPSTKTNGTEEDLKLSSEWILQDIDHTKLEKYFRAKIDLSTIKNSNLIDEAMTNDSTEKYFWYPIRLPVNAVNDSVFEPMGGTPDWKKIAFVRFLWTDFSFQDAEDMKKEYQIEFTGIKFTGNKWNAVPLGGDTGEVKITPTVLNSFDDRGSGYSRPWGIDSMDSEDTKIKDYALRLEYKDLKGGEEAMVKRVISTYQTIDLSSYEEIRMYLNEDTAKIFKESDVFKTENIISSVLREDLVNFVFRFGRSDSCYYEYRTSSLKNHWRKGQGLRISLKGLSAFKQSYYNDSGETFKNVNIADTLQDGSIIRIFSKTGLMPLFSDIKWMALGVLRNDGAIGLADGDIWVHGIRVKGLKALGGLAFRADLKTQWADFMDFSATFDYFDADFRQMSEEPFQPDASSKMSASLNAQWQISKFLPEKWGVNIPFGTSVLASMARPKRRPGSDVSLTNKNGEPDKIGDMAKDFADLIFDSDLSKQKTAAEHFEKNSIKKSWYTSYSKTTDSENPVTNLTADRITTNYNFAKDSTTDLFGLISEKDKQELTMKNIGDDHVFVNSKHTHGASFKYDFTPRKHPKWTIWSPFAKVKGKKFPTHLKDYEFKLLPNRVNFDLLEGNFERTYSYKSFDDLKDTLGSSARSIEYLGLTHGFQYSHSPISPILETDFDISVNRDFNEALAQWGHSSTTKFIKERVFQLDPVWRDYWVTYAENSRTQNANIRFDPKIFDWISHTADYRSNYSQTPKSLGNTRGYLNGRPRSDFGFTSNLRLRSLFTSLEDITEKIKGLSKSFGVMGKGLDKIGLSSVNFNYNASLDLNNDFLDVNFLSAEDVYFYDFTKYQLGVKHRSFKDIITGNIDDDNAFGGPRYRINKGYDYDLYKNDVRNTHQDYRISTSMRLPKPIDVNINNISLGWKRDYQKKWDILYLDSSVTFPDIQVGASSKILEKIPLVKQHMNNLDLNSAYTFSKTEVNRKSDNLLRKDFTIGQGWNPLVSLNGQLKKRPINVDYTYSFRIDETTTEENGKDTEKGRTTKVHGNEWNVKYDIPGKPDREWKLFRGWVVKIKGDVSMSLNISYNANETKDLSRVPEEQNQRDWKLSVHPLVTYDFTDNIDGLLEYIFEKEYNDYNDENITFNRFAFTLTIYFK